MSWNANSNKAPKATKKTIENEPSIYDHIGVDINYDGATWLDVDAQAFMEMIHTITSEHDAVMIKGRTNGSNLRFAIYHEGSSMPFEAMDGLTMTERILTITTDLRKAIEARDKRKGS